MAPTLRDSLDRELALLARVEALSGTSEARHAQLAANDIGTAYQQIHRGYLQLRLLTSPRAALASSERGEFVAAIGRGGFSLASASR